MEKAWKAAPKGSGTAIRIAKIYRARGQDDASVKVLREALAREADDKAVHFELALTLLATPAPDEALVEQHLRKSFSRDDNNFEHRHVLAQFMFSLGKIEDAAALFDEVSRRAPEYFRTKPPREDNAITGRLPTYTGTISAQKDGYLSTTAASARDCSTQAAPAGKVSTVTSENGSWIAETVVVSPSPSKHVRNAEHSAALLNRTAAEPAKPN